MIQQSITFQNYLTLLHSKLVCIWNTHSKSANKSFRDFDSQVALGYKRNIYSQYKNIHLIIFRVYAILYRFRYMFYKYPRLK